MGGGADDMMKSGMLGMIPGMFGGGGGGSGGGSDTSKWFTGGAPGGTPGAPTPPPGGGTGGPVQVPTKTLPGYTNPLSLFGRLSPEQLTQFNKENGITLPKPPPRGGSAPAGSTLPPTVKKPKYGYNDA